MRHRISLLIVVAFLGASCGGTDAALNPTQPSQPASPLSVGVSTHFIDGCRGEGEESFLPLRHAIQRAARRRGPAVRRGQRCRYRNPRAVFRHVGLWRASSDVACARTHYAVRDRTGQRSFRAGLSRDDRDRLRYRTYGDYAHHRRDPRLARTNRNGSSDCRCAVVERTLQPRPRRARVGRALHPVAGPGAFPGRRLRPDRACRRRRDARARASERE